MGHGRWSTPREVRNSAGEVIRHVRIRVLARGMTETQWRKVGETRWVTMSVSS